MWKYCSTFVVCVTLAACSSAPPPVQVSADDYYEQGLAYKKRGRIELARESLKKAIELDHVGMARKRAQHLLDTQLPREPVSQDAEQRNAIGFNQLAKHDVAAAKKTFEDLIHDCPNFEWPYLNLAMIHVQEEDDAAAVPLLEKAIEINPSYAKALWMLAKIKDQQGDATAARKYANKCRELESASPDYSPPVPPPGTKADE